MERRKEERPAGEQPSVAEIQRTQNVPYAEAVRIRDEAQAVTPEETPEAKARRKRAAAEAYVDRERARQHARVEELKAQGGPWQLAKKVFFKEETYGGKENVERLHSLEDQMEEAREAGDLDRLEELRTELIDSQTRFRAEAEAKRAAEAKAAGGASSRPGSYTPERPLPTDKKGVPTPDSSYPHTQLGRSKPKYGSEPQAREWGHGSNGNLQPKRDIDFTNHGTPEIHPNPHQHTLTPNNSTLAPQGGYRRGPPEPL